MYITKKELLRLFLSLITVTGSGCAKPTRKPDLPTDTIYSPRNLYGFQHHETTGVTSFIRVGGREQPIQFASDSSRQALDLLYGLRSDVFLPLTDGKHLFVVGELSRTESQTRGGANRANSEPFRAFRLRGWYIVVPFEQWHGLEAAEQPRKITRTELRADDFDSSTLPGLFFTPRRYQKTQAEHWQFVAQYAEK